MSFKLKSDVWKYFSKINANTAKCKYCTKTIKTSGNTSNLKGHLNIHKRQIEQKSEDIGVCFLLIEEDSMLNILYLF